MAIYITPIKPVFAYRIFIGLKKYELRKIPTDTSPVKTSDRIILYVTGRVKAFMGEYRVGEVIEGTPDHIIKVLSRIRGSGVGREDFKYIMGSRRVIAIEVVDPTIYRSPIELKKIFRIFPDYRPPAGFQKLCENEPLVTMVFNRARRHVF